MCVNVYTSIWICVYICIYKYMNIYMYMEIAHRHMSTAKAVRQRRDTNLYIDMYTLSYVYIHTYIRILHMFIHIYIVMYINIYTYIRILHMFIYTCLIIFIHIYNQTNGWIKITIGNIYYSFQRLFGVICTYVYVNIYVCIFIYMHTYTHEICLFKVISIRILAVIYAFTHIHIRTYRGYPRLLSTALWGHPALKKALFLPPVVLSYMIYIQIHKYIFM
jgi:hypothetical protein